MDQIPAAARVAGVEMITADNFKLIKGIGPAVEHRLHAAGVLTFGQLAALSPADIATKVSSLAELSANRIMQQDWVGRARELASQSGKARLPLANGVDRQRYATFTVELLVDEANQVRRTRLVHIQDGDEDTWTGWEETRLARFVTEQHAALGTQPVAPAPLPLIKTNLSGQPRLNTLTATSVGTDYRRNFLNQYEAFDVHLVLELSSVTGPPGVIFNYNVTIYAKRLTDGLREVVAETNGTANLSNNLTLKVRGQTLPSGLYRLEAAANLNLLSTELGLTTFLEGSLLQVNDDFSRGENYGHK